MQRVLLLVCVIAAVVLPSCVAEGDFPPPPMPKRPQGFNIYCDVCQTMVKRVVPYCQREEMNMDYLPDFCVFNYNKVLVSATYRTGGGGTTVPAFSSLFIYHNSKKFNHFVSLTYRSHSILSLENRM
jgi:hypothetical protein